MQALQHEREVDLWRYRSSRSAEPSPDHVEEGLNEAGEAPPPYVPSLATDEESRNESTQNLLAAPSPTLSRSEAGLKPPEYTPRPT